MNFYYENEGVTLGPVEAEGLRDRNINKSTRVWRAGMADWQAAGEVPELAFLFDDETVAVDDEATVAAGQQKKSKKKNHVRKKSCPHEWVGESKFMIGFSIAVIIFFIIAALVTQRSTPYFLAAAMIFPIIAGWLALKKANTVKDLYLDKSLKEEESITAAKQANLYMQISFFAAAIIISAYWYLEQILRFSE